MRKLLSPSFLICQQNFGTPSVCVEVSKEGKKIGVGKMSVKKLTSQILNIHAYIFLAQ